MKILAFDTSNNTTSVAISEGQNILAYFEDLTPSAQAEKLILLTERALKFAKLSYDDIDCLAVTNGPGSFTGIRIGLATTKGILLAKDMPATAVTNFEIAYYRASGQVGFYNKMIIFLNAYRGQLYTQIFEDNSNFEPMLINYAEAIQLLQNSSGKIVCAGSGLEFIYNQELFPPNITFLPRFPRIKALHICRYVDLTWLKRKLLPIEPLYIRPPDAKTQIP